MGVGGTTQGMGNQEVGIIGDQLGDWLKETTKSEPKKLESPVILVTYLVMPCILWELSSPTRD